MPAPLDWGHSRKAVLAERGCGIADSATTKTNRPASETPANRGDCSNYPFFCRLGRGRLALRRAVILDSFLAAFDQAAFAAVLAIGPPLGLAPDQTAQPAEGHGVWILPPLLDHATPLHTLLTCAWLNERLATHLLIHYSKRFASICQSTLSFLFRITIHRDEVFRRTLVGFHLVT